MRVILREAEQHAVGPRPRAARQAGARAPRYHGDTVLAADAQHGEHLGFGLRQHHQPRLLADRREPVGLVDATAAFAGDDAGGG
jgi:hypothetical protein